VNSPRNDGPELIEPVAASLRLTPEPLLRYTRPMVARENTRADAFAIFAPCAATAWRSMMSCCSTARRSAGGTST
jgi:hypothetical protein